MDINTEPLEEKVNQKNNSRTREVEVRRKKSWAVLLKYRDQTSQVMLNVLWDQMNSFLKLET